MGANRAYATPEEYPAAFLAIVRQGRGILYAHDIPWSLPSAAKRFRLLVRLLRESPKHPLHPLAGSHWTIRLHRDALEIAHRRSTAVAYGRAPSLAGPLIDDALAD